MYSCINGFCNQSPSEIMLNILYLSQLFRYPKPLKYLPGFSVNNLIMGQGQLHLELCVKSCAQLSLSLFFELSINPTD